MSDFLELVDLAAERIGGQALFASDDFFASKDNLLKPGRGVFIDGKYTENGKWMDGWESRRKREAGYDWCVIRLGVPGVIHGVDVDTNHFLGNYPQFASLEACTIDENPDSIFPGDPLPWKEIVAKQPLKGGSQHLFPVESRERFTHVRLNIFPDGGVARLRVYGVVRVAPESLRGRGLVDLAAVQNGGVVVACNDQFFGARHNLIMPGRSENMGDGWETKRKRRHSFEELMADADWIILRLAAPGKIRRIEVDTNHFKGNFPESCLLEATHSDTDQAEALNSPRTHWHSLLPRTKLRASTRHFFEQDVQPTPAVTHVRMKIFPDGGISRLRLYGDME